MGMGLPADAQGDMFSKLETMRETIKEVNRQFQNPVCFGRFSLALKLKSESSK